MTSYFSVYIHRNAGKETKEIQQIIESGTQPNPEEKEKEHRLSAAKTMDKVDNLLNRSPENWNTEQCPNWNTEQCPMTTATLRMNYCPEILNWDNRRKHSDISAPSPINGADVGSQAWSLSQYR